MGLVITKGNVNIGQGVGWVPPSDWTDLGVVENNEILILSSDVNPNYSFRVTVNDGYFVDWGDGTVTEHLTNTNAIHNYIVGSGKPCSRGYTTFKIRIFPQNQSNDITRFLVSCPTTLTTWNTILWVKFGTTGLTSCSNMFYNDSEGMSDILNSVLLEKITLPNNLINCLSFQSSFMYCKSLISIDMPNNYSSSVLSFNNICYNCSSLTKFSFNTNYIKISTLSSSFSNCSNLKEIKFPLFISQLTNISFMCHNCTSLENINIFDIDTNISLGPYSFNGVNSLKHLIFPSSWENKILNLYTAISSTSISELKLPLNIQNTSYIGVYTPKLKHMRFPNIINGSWDDFQWDYQGFSNNTNLETLDNFPAIRKWWNVSSSNATGASQIFKNCYNLKNINKNNLSELGTLNPLGISIDWDRALSIDNLEFKAMFSGRFILRGISLTKRASLTNLLFTNPNNNSSWGGSSPQIDISYCSMNDTSLNNLFNSIVNTQMNGITGKVCRITGNPGADTCDTTIMTNNGWSINKIN